MASYITGFIFYTMAMIGILVVGFLVYKKTSVFGQNNTKGLIRIIDSLAIGPKKVLMIVKVKNEKFLIASSGDNTTFLAKLEKNENQIPQELINFNQNDEINSNKFSQELINSNNEPTRNYNLASNEEFDSNLIKNKKAKNIADNILENNSKLQKLQKQFNNLYEQESINPQQLQDTAQRQNFSQLQHNQTTKSNLKEQYMDKIYTQNKIQNAAQNKIKKSYENYLNKQEVIKKLLN